MENIIVSVLKDNGRVIIPDFGAFIIKSKNPFKVIFNEFLQYNDGALIGAVATESNIERDEAAEKVKTYVKELTGKLNQGKAISIEGIGLLAKSSTGKISLEEGKSETQAESAPAAKEEPTSVEFDTSEDKKEEPPKEEKKEEKKPIAQEEPKTPPKPAPVKSTAEKKPTPKPTQKPAPVKETPVKESPPPTKEHEPTPISEYYEDDSRNKINIIVWIVLIVLVNAAIVGIFFFGDEIKGLFSKKDKAPIETTIETPAITNEQAIPADTTPEEEELVIEEPEEEPEESFVTKPITGKKYYVVAGVFREESNADNLVTELRKKGYNAEKFGKIGSMHAVSYDVFPNKSDADKLMLKIKKEIDSDAWIKVVN